MNAIADIAKPRRSAKLPANRKDKALEEALLEGLSKKDAPLVITRPNFQRAVVTIQGDAPLVVHAFSQKSQEIIRATQEAGQQAKKGRKRDPKDFDLAYNNARHVSTDGWDGFPASAIRNAMISACRTVGFKMTIAKMSVFCIADGYDSRGTPLVKITKGKPTMHVGPARNATGTIDLRARPMWQQGWQARVSLKWDADQFSATDIINLLARVGEQVGLCEGRPDSKMSAGCGWGTFTVLE